jgi:hypothetical protein
MHRLKEIKSCLTDMVQTEMHDLERVDAHEMGEVIDMIKDLSEAMYYCSIVDAMEHATDEEKLAHDKTMRMEDHMKMTSASATEKH